MKTTGFGVDGTYETARVNERVLPSDVRVLPCQQCLWFKGRILGCASEHQVNESQTLRTSCFFLNANIFSDEG